MNTNTEHLPTEKEQQFTYMLLSRLQSDCNYFLGHGNKSQNILWAGNTQDQINEMKELYNSLTVKPQWLSMDDINEYHTRMTQEQAETK